MKFTVDHGLRPRLLNRSAEADIRFAIAGTMPSSPFQNRRTSSRNLSFHSAQPGGKPPTW